MRYRWQGFLCVLSVALSCASPARAADVDEAQALIKGGATQLALRVVESGQKSDLPPEEWARWERQRLDILQALRQWDGIAQRVERLPENVIPEFRRYALLAAANARLAADDAGGARRYLRRLLWQESLSEVDAAQVRRLIIRSYLQQGALDDALTALKHYERDYRSKSEPWQILQAEILLQAGEPAKAVDTLAGLQSYDARLLRMLAELRARRKSPQDIASAANKLADELSAHPAQQRSAWIVAAEAARAGDRDEAHVLALEQALSIGEASTSPLFQVSADDLWRAYDEYAENGGNAVHLFVGDDEPWLDRAESIPCTTNYLARAYYAFLSQRASDAEVRALAHRRLAAGLMRDGRSQTLQALYTQSTRYPAVKDIPVEVRYALADKAIAEFNIRLAAELVRDLDRAPEGELPEAWALRRARVLVYAGDYAPAAALLDGIVRSETILDPNLTGRLLQVLFDLQAVGRHEDALRLLEVVYARVSQDRLRRELLFWMADSQSALKHYETAAELYLRSASFGGTNGDDPWGHSARFHAAEALGHAGLNEDARRVYARLLEATADPRQRAQIERQMQQLWLTRKTP